MATGSKAGLYQNALSDSYLPLTTAQKPKNHLKFQIFLHNFTIFKDEMKICDFLFAKNLFIFPCKFFGENYMYYFR